MEIRFAELDDSARIDSEFFQKKLLRLEEEVLSRPHQALSKKGRFIPGPFGSEFHVENYEEQSAFRYVRGKDVKPFFLEDSDNVYIPEADFTRLDEFSLREDDVLISVVGTLGNASIVTNSDHLAIFSCKSTVLRGAKNAWFLVTYLNSGPGRSLLLRKTRGAVQTGLNLADLRSLPVPDFGSDLQGRIGELARTAHVSLRNSKRLFSEAEQTLLRALGLDTWQPPEPLTYERRASEAFGAGRLDAEYASPRVQGLLGLLGSQGLTVGSVAKLRKEYFRPSRRVGGSAEGGFAHHPGGRGPAWADGPPLHRLSFQYIEISDVTAGGEVGSSPVDAAEAPDRATWHVRSGDVVTSTVRPIRRLSALITPEQDGFVCSSGFAVLQPREVPPEVLLTYLRLPVIAELMDLHTTASLYPAISVPDILALPFVKPPAEVAAAIVKAVRDSHAARKQAHALLERAKRAVEIAIEEGEAAALAYLEGAGNDAAGQAPPYGEASIGGGPGRVGSAHQDLPPAQVPVGAAHPTTAPAAPTDPTVPQHIPQAILAHLTPGRTYSKAELCAALHLTPAEGTWAIRDLRSSGKVVQTGERRGARYMLAGRR